MKRYVVLVMVTLCLSFGSLGCTSTGLDGTTQSISFDFVQAAELVQLIVAVKSALAEGEPTAEEEAAIRLAQLEEQRVRMLILLEGMASASDILARFGLTDFISANTNAEMKSVIVTN